MPDPSVKMTFFGNQADAERAIVKLEQKYDKLEARMKGVTRTSKKSTGGMVAGFVKAQLSVTALTGLLHGALSHMQRMRMEAEATAIALDASARKFQIQANLSNLQSAVAQKRVGEIATISGVSPQSINRIATEAASQGFRGDPLATGGLVDVLVATLQSANVDPAQADLEGFTAAIAKELRSSDRELNAANAKDIAIRARGLFKDTPFQVADLEEFSRARKVATTVNLTEQEFLSAAAILKGSDAAAEGSTGLRKVLLRLGAPEGSAQKEMDRILGPLGMKRQDVDLVGENLQTALARLDQAVQRLPEAERLGALKSVFGEKAAVSGLALVQGARQGQFDKFAKLQTDTEAFESGVRVARSGLAAGIGKGKAVLANTERKLVAGGGITLTEARQQFEIEEQRKQAPGFVGDPNNPRDATGLFDVYFRKLLFEATAFGGHPGMTVDRDEILRRRKSDFTMQDLLQQQNETLQKIEHNTDLATPRVNRNANVE